MDPIILFIIVVVVLGGAFWYFNAEKDNTASVGETEVKPEPVAKVEPKPAPAPKAEVKKLPTKSKLTAMKKAELEELGREFGVELDKRKTKDNMIADLQKEVKKQ